MSEDVLRFSPPRWVKQSGFGTAPTFPPSRRCASALILPIAFARAQPAATPCPAVIAWQRHFKVLGISARSCWRSREAVWRYTPSSERNPSNRAILSL
jgi:hypothetical protein